MDISSVFKDYDFKDLTVGVLGSHSALDICSGAKKSGFKTLVISEKGREKTYSQYYGSRHGSGCIDETVILEKFKDILNNETQKSLKERNLVFIPHRSFEVYLNFDYDAIENKFELPIFGNRNILKIEERSRHPNQYDLLREAGIKSPLIFEKPEDIDRPVLVKVLEKARGFERAFFIVNSHKEYKEKSEEFLEKGIVTKDALENAVIEEFLMGVQVNLNYFYSPIFNRLEFLGSDTRRQTNIEGFLRLPSFLQEEAQKYGQLKFEEAGHIAVTVLESTLEDVFAIGERFIEAAKKLYMPGIIGPFALQCFILPGPPKKELVVFDVSPRVPGSPGIRFTPYGEYLWGRPMSVGERIGLEIKEAIAEKSIQKILT